MKIFQIEYIHESKEHAFFFARKVGEFDFASGQGSRLGPIRLKPIVNQPRALNDDGTPDLDIFAFYPISRALLQQIAVGEVLELIE